MIDKTKICSKYLEKVGRAISYVDSSAIETEFYGVIEPTWRRNKTNFDDNKTMLGRVQINYYLYLGPSHFDITALPDNAVLISDGYRYEFMKKEKVVIGGIVQFYTGVLRRIEEDEYGYY